MSKLDKHEINRIQNQISLSLTNLKIAYIHAQIIDTFIFWRSGNIYKNIKLVLLFIIIVLAEKVVK